MKKFLGVLAIIVLVGICAFFFLHDKLQITGNSSGSNENSSTNTQSEVQNKQEPNNSPLTISDAEGIVARTVNISDLVWKYYDTMMIQGEKYIAFAGHDKGGSMGDTLIVINEINGKVYSYDTLGNLRDYSDYEKSVKEWMAKAEKANGAVPLNATEDIKLVDGNVLLSGFYTGMGLDEGIYQMLANNKITTTKTREELRREISAQQSHDGGRDGNDIIPFGNQKMFGIPCDIKLNYSSGQSDDGTWGGSPYLEEIRVGFNQDISDMKNININNLDLDEQVKSKFISILGEPSTIKASEDIPESASAEGQDQLKSNTSVIYRWELENDRISLYYIDWKDEDNKVEGFERGNVLGYLFVTSRSYIVER